MHTIQAVNKQTARLAKVKGHRIPAFTVMVYDDNVELKF